MHIIPEHDESTLLLLGVDPSLPEQQAVLERERRQKAKNESVLNQRQVAAINGFGGELAREIERLQGLTARELLRQRTSIWATLDKKLDDIKLQLKHEHDRKKDDNYDYKEREKELNGHLETMTQIAQRIDEENRALMKKNGELRIEYLSQENDRDLLLRQLITQKKESQKLRGEAESLRQQAL